MRGSSTLVGRTNLLVSFWIVRQFKALNFG
jgi:hypothetical protein